ncbi:MAG: adenylosuccinate synthase, partial [Candidatus Methanofastidiosia archaeon]
MLNLVIGTQWGDEGKGKVVDFYSERADFVARFQGGANAGHTVVVGKKKYKFHQLPSGAVRGKKVVIGNGCVVDPEILLEEISKLRREGISFELFISDRAHLILPYHKIQDKLEESLKGKVKAGTTMRGIGPCYQDKIGRFGVRFCDLVDEEVLREKLEILVPLKQRILSALGEEILLDLDEIFESYNEYGKVLRGHITDTSLLINKALDEGKKVLLEGAQGTHLDIDHGIYPFNTSSSTTAGGACIGVGVSPKRVSEIVGVLKAYTTRVGEGPMPTELSNELGDYLREKGGEYGTTTGRPRRCGWLDMVLLRYSERINRFTGLAITKLDVLSGLKKLKVCVSYSYKGKEMRDFPAGMKILSECEAVYKEFKGFKDFKAGKYDDLPREAKIYLRFISEELKVPIYLVSI